MKLTLITITIFFTILFGAVDIRSATLTVTNTNDAGTGSLRDAIFQSHLNAEADTIVFDSQAFNSPKTITLTGGQLPVGATLTIEGPGASLLTISSNHQSRIFSETSGYGNDLIIKNLSLTNGFATNGGAVYSQNSVKLYNVVITGNTAMGAEVSPGGFYAGLGGGIYSRGSLTIVDSTISGNLASGIVIHNTNPLYGDYTSAGGGGSIFFSGFGANIINCTFINNTAKGPSSPNAGPDQSADSGGYAYGGAVYGFTPVYIINSRFFNNSAVGGGGGSTVGGQTSGAGGGAFGGAVYSSGARFLNSTFKNNLAVGGTAGASSLTYRVSKGGESAGGGIFDLDMQMANVTVVNNTVTAGTGRIGGDASGGGIYLYGNSQWRIYNSTITGNRVTGGFGFFMDGLSQGGGVYSKPGSNQSSFYNNIVAENSADSGKDVFGSFYNPANNLIGIGNGTADLNNGERGNKVGTLNSPIDPLLAPLADNGGLTETRALLSGSPAIDAGNNSYAINPFSFQPPQPVVFDQRNFQRIFPNGGVVDIGAYESGASVVPTSTSPDLQNASDTGLSDTDNITKATAAVFNISNTIPGAGVELLRDNVVISSVVATSFSVSIKDSNPPLDGTVQYIARQTIGGVASANSPLLSVTFDHTPPNVTISQYPGQTDPAAMLPIRFTVAFSEPVSGFDRQDISLAGSTAGISNGGIYVTATSSSTYLVEISSVRSPGEIILTIPAQAAYDYVINYSNAPTYTDNKVTFQPNIIGVSVSGQVRKNSGKIRTSTTVILTNNDTGEIWTARTNPFGYYQFSDLKIYQQIGSNFSVKLNNKNFVYYFPLSVGVTNNISNLNFTVP